MNRLWLPILAILLMNACLTVMPRDTPDSETADVWSADGARDTRIEDQNAWKCDPTDRYACTFGRECLALGPTADTYCECVAGWRCGDMACPGVICDTCSGDPLALPSDSSYIAKDDLYQCCIGPEGACHVGTFAEPVPDASPDPS